MNFITVKKHSYDELAFDVLGNFKIDKIILESIVKQLHKKVYGKVIDDNLIYYCENYTNKYLNKMLNDGVVILKSNNLIINERIFKNERYIYDCGY